MSTIFRYIWSDGVCSWNYHHLPRKTASIGVICTVIQPIQTAVYHHRRWSIAMPVLAMILPVYPIICGLTTPLRREACMMPAASAAQISSHCRQPSCIAVASDLIRMGCGILWRMACRLILPVRMIPKPPPSWLRGPALLVPMSRWRIPNGLRWRLTRRCWSRQQMRWKFTIIPVCCHQRGAVALRLPIIFWMRAIKSALPPPMIRILTCLISPVAGWWWRRRNCRRMPFLRH